MDSSRFQRSINIHNQLRRSCLSTPTVFRYTPVVQTTSSDGEQLAIGHWQLDASFSRKRCLESHFQPESYPMTHPASVSTPLDFSSSIRPPFAYHLQQVPSSTPVILRLESYPHSEVDHHCPFPGGKEQLCPAFRTFQVATGSPSLIAFKEAYGAPSFEQLHSPS